MKNRYLPVLPILLFFLCLKSLSAQNNVVQIFGPSFLCLGACDTLTAVVGGQLPVPYTYLWSISGPGGYTSTSTSPNLWFCPGATGTPLLPGVYFIKVSITSADGQSVMGVFTLTVLSYMPLEILSNNTAPCNNDTLLSSDQCEKICPNTTVTYSVQNPSPGGTQGQLQWFVSGASSYILNNPPFNSSVTVNWGGAGQGSVSVFSSSTIGCSGEDALCVTIISQPEALFSSSPAASAPAPLQVCKGQTVYFTNQSTGADTYQWFFSDDASNTSEVNPQHTFFNPGTYTVTLISRSECLCADTTTMSVEVLDAESPALDCIGTVCPGATVTYTVSSGCAPFTWSVSGNGSIVGGGTAGIDSITVQWTAGPVGTITLGAQPCSGSACPTPADLQIPIISDAAEIQGPDRVCPSSTETYTIAPYGGTNFVWTLPTGGVITAGQGTNRITVDWGNFPNPAQTHWLSVVYDNCYLGCGGQDSLAVLLLSPFIINGPVERCEGGTGPFNAFLTFNNQAISCNWTLIAPDGSTAWTSAAPGANVTVPFNNGGGLYRLSAMPVNPNATCTLRAGWVIDVTPLPAQPTAIAGSRNICPGSSYTYTAQGVAPNINVRWTVQNGPGAPVIFSGNPLNITWANNGPRWVAAATVSTNGLNCTSDTTRIDINQINAVDITGDAIVCEDANGFYSIPGVDNIDIQWQISPPTAAAIAAGQGSNAVEIFWTEAGGHVISIAVCGQNATFPVTVPANPAPVVQYTAAVCPGVLSAVQTSTVFSAYRWLDETGALLSTAASPTFPAGSFAVEVTDGFGCSGVSEFTVDETASPNLTISTADPTGFCNNASFVTLTALGSFDLDFTYQWFQNGTPVGGNTPTFSTNQYGSYTCQVSNQFGCTASAGPVVLFNYCGGGGGGFGAPGGGLPPCPAGSISIGINPTTACDTFLFSAIGPSYTPGTASWVFAQSGASIIGSDLGDDVDFAFPNAGKYLVFLTAQLASGAFCIVVDSVSVEAVAQFDPAPGCPGYPTTFKNVATFLPPGNIVNWQWNFGDVASGVNNTSVLSDPSHNFTAAGTFQVELSITGASGCIASVKKPVEIPAPAPLTLAPPPFTCTGNALEFVATGNPEVTGIDWDFGDPASGPSNDASGSPAYHSFSPPGTYTVTATSTNVYGCTALFTQSVTVTPNPLSGTIVPTAPSTICEGSTLTLTAPPGAVAYAWSDSLTTTQTITVGLAGNYAVTLTDANGCTYVPPPVQVNVTPSPDALIKAFLENELGQVIGTAYPSLSTCAGEDVHLVAIGNGSYGYSWSGGNGTLNEIFFTEDRNNLLAVGIYVYTVTVTDFTSGCTAVTDPFVVDVHPVPSGFSVAANGSCANTSTVLSYSGPTPANWQFFWNTGQSGTTLTTEDPGTYYIRVINEFGCEARSNGVNILPGPPVAAIPGGCHTRCKPDTLCMPALPTIVSWQWFYNGSAIPGATGSNFIADQSGTYWAQVTDIYGCPGQSDPLTLNLFDGTGNIDGQVWSDVNNNGIIDAGDTLVSGIPILLLESGSTVGTAQSGAVGDYAFPNILSTGYVVAVDGANLGSSWQIVIGQDPVTLSGCGALGTSDLLIKFVCLPVATDLQLFACPGSAAPYNGTFVASGTSQVFPFTSAAGCDSLVTVTVGVLANTSASFNTSVCPGASYVYNGVSIPAGQSATVILQNAAGCDSTVTVSVSTLAASASSLAVSVCPGQSYDYFGSPIPIGQSANFTFQNYLGCDSTVTVTVSALPNSTGAVQASVCPGETFDYFGTLLNGGDVATFTLQNTAGCDSIVTVTVSALQSTASTVAGSACPGGTYTYNGTTLNVGDSQQFILTNEAGCDSIVTVNVTALETSAFTVMAGACPGGTYTYNGTVLQVGDTQQFTLTNAAGCDSIVTVQVNALSTSASALSPRVCPGETYTYNGVALQPGDVQTFTFINAAGCDSLVTVTVGQLAVSANTLEFTVCPGQTYDYNGTAIPAGETRDFHFFGFEGCDSTVTVTITGFPEAVFDLQSDPSCPNASTGSLAVLNSSGGLPPYRYALDGSSYQDETFFEDLAPGNYTVYLQDGNGCVFERDTLLGVLPGLEVTLMDGILPCDSSGVLLAPLLNVGPLGLVFNWWNGATTPSITVADPGPIWVEVTNECETVRREASVNWADLDGRTSFVYVPNIFAPESDNYENSVFKPFFAPGLTLLSYTFEVFDRWGNLMFRTSQQDAGWDGVFRVKDFQPGVCVWYIVAKVAFCGKIIEIKKMGDVTIKR